MANIDIITALIIALFIIVVVLIIYKWCVEGLRRLRFKRRRRRVKQQLRNSSGRFDRAARQALRGTYVDNPTIGDLIDRNNILLYNFSEGAPSPAVLDNVTDNYIEALQLAAFEEDEEPEPMLLFDAVDNFLTQDWVDNFMLLDQLEAVTAAQTPKIIAKRKEKVRPTANKMEASADYLSEAIKHTEDLQSSHDSNVNKDLRDTIAKLARGYDHERGAQVFEDMRQYVASDTKAVRVFEHMRGNALISTFGHGEFDILQMVWYRSMIPANTTNANNIKDAVRLALADSIDNAGNIVCINGRVTRVVNALALIDHDPTLGVAMTTEMYKNQIYEETQKIIMDTIADHAANLGSRYHEVAKSYNTSNPIESPEFDALIAKEITDNIDTYAGRISPVRLEQLKAECIAAL